MTKVGAWNDPNGQPKTWGFLPPKYQHHFQGCDICRSASSKYIDKVRVGLQSTGGWKNPANQEVLHQHLTAKAEADHLDDIRGTSAQDQDPRFPAVKKPSKSKSSQEQAKRSSTPTPKPLASDVIDLTTPIKAEHYSSPALLSMESPSRKRRAEESPVSSRSTKLPKRIRTTSKSKPTKSHTLVSKHTPESNALPMNPSSDPEARPYTRTRGQLARFADMQTHRTVSDQRTKSTTGKIPRSAVADSEAESSFHSADESEKHESDHGSENDSSPEASRGHESNVSFKKTNPQRGPKQPMPDAAALKIMRDEFLTLEDMNLTELQEEHDTLVGQGSALWNDPFSHKQPTDLRRDHVEKLMTAYDKRAEDGTSTSKAYNATLRYKHDGLSKLPSDKVVRALSEPVGWKTAHKLCKQNGMCFLRHHQYEEDTMSKTDATYLESIYQMMTSIVFKPAKGGQPVPTWKAENDPHVQRVIETVILASANADLNYTVESTLVKEDEPASDKGENPDGPPATVNYEISLATILGVPIHLFASLEAEDEAIKFGPYDPSAIALQQALPANCPPHIKHIKIVAKHPKVPRLVIDGILHENVVGDDDGWSPPKVVLPDLVVPNLIVDLNKSDNGWGSKDNGGGWQLCKHD